MANCIVQTRRLLGIVATSLSVLVIAAGYASGQSGAPVPAPPPFTSPDIKPTFADWLTGSPMALSAKTALTDPLLKPPFAGAAPNSLKGMAAGIRSVQLDVPNRIKAVRYLGTVDCVTYPQAQEMLIATMENDPSEAVRYEAVMALRNMLTRGCCNMDTACQCNVCKVRKKIVRETEKHAKKAEKALIKEAKGHAKLLAKKMSRQAEDERYDCCRGCANEKVMKALAEVASAKDDQCCWAEPSERVRQAASDAMYLFNNYSDSYNLAPGIPESAPVKEEEKEVEPMEEKESIPVPTREVNSETTQMSPALKMKPDSSVTISKLRSVAPQVVQTQTNTYDPEDPFLPELKSTPENPGPPAVPGLKGRCIVALKSRQILPVDPQISSVFKGRTYYFSSAAAKAAFDEEPAKYAPAYGGVDPVNWLMQRQMVDGQYLREFNGQFFMFATKENWETFKGNPNRYVLRSRESNVQTVSASDAR